MRITKIRLFFSLLLLATGAHATGQGFYMGVQVGQTNLHNKAMNVYQTATPAVPTGAQLTEPSNTGFGGRIFMGGNITRNLGMEIGYTYLGASYYNPAIDIPTLCSTPSIREDAIDIVAKAMMPFCGFNLFLKGGIAALRASYSGSLILPSINGACSNSKPQIHARPVAAIGAGYDLNQNVEVDLSYMRIFKGSGVQNADFLALGISYHFVDRYCGQFLC